MADEMAKSGSTAKVSGPEPFIAVPYVSCKAEIREWFKKRWKTSWTNSRNCLRTKEHVGWVSPRLSQRLIGLSRRNLNQVLQVLTGHCNLQRHKKTTGRSTVSLCPKCNLEDEIPDHHVGRCRFYQDIRGKYLGSKLTSINRVIDKLNVSKLAT